MPAQSIFIVAAKRTPFGAFGGKLKHLTATDLAVHAAKGAISSIELDPSKIKTVHVGNVAQTSRDAAYIARHVGLRAGLPIETPALTVNRLCGSGFQSVINGMQDLLLGEADIALCGGSESMSQAPLSVFGDKARWGTPLGAGLALEDTLWSALTDSYAKSPMGITAENLAEKHGIKREDCDAFALRSQKGWAAANEAGRFAAEIAPITLKGKKGEEVMDSDEGPRPQTTIEALNKLKPVFKKDGTVTAGNASGISDGAGAIIIATEEAVKANNLKPLARIAAYSVAGVDPKIMGIGPVPAIREALKRANLKLDDMDLLEINEAFAPQFLACQKELGFDMSIANLNGGAIALGHPLASSGSRITAHLAHELVRTGKKYAVGSACIGGGQGIALILENAN